MTLIARLLGWLWGTETATPAPDEDRSSMADLARLLSVDKARTVLALAAAGVALAALLV